jgi:hypothetical protein
MNKAMSFEENYVNAAFALEQKLGDALLDDRVAATVMTGEAATRSGKCRGCCPSR